MKNNVNLTEEIIPISNTIFFSLGLFYSIIYFDKIYMCPKLSAYYELFCCCRVSLKSETFVSKSYEMRICLQ